METMVRFESDGTAYCLPLQVTRSVRTAEGLTPLPEPAAEVAGLIPDDPPLPVISPLGATGTTGAQIVVVEVGDRTFGLLVDQVTGLCRVDPAEIRPAPHGQERPLVCGTVHADGRLILVADALALGARL